MKIRFSYLFLLFLCTNANAEVLDLTIALQNTYRNCAGIDDDLHDLKVLAGVNTAVTAVGTGLGIGATATGITKASVDKKADKIEAELLAEINKLEELGKKQTQIDIIPDLNVLMANTPGYSKNSDINQINEKQEELEKLNKKSKNLGNWRTGLMAGSTATSIAGAIIANKSKADKDLQEQIDKCVSSVKDLNNAILAAKMNGEDIGEAQTIYDACRNYEYVDITPINKRATGAMVASSIGAVTGGIGTITSGVANSDKIRNDNTDDGKKKEKNLNTASNVLAGATTVASATATVFNATQIAAIKKVASVSEKCTGVLK